MAKDSTDPTTHLKEFWEKFFAIKDMPSRYGSYVAGQWNSPGWIWHAKDVSAVKLSWKLKEGSIECASFQEGGEHFEVWEELKRRLTADDFKVVCSNGVLQPAYGVKIDTFIFLIELRGFENLRRAQLGLSLIPLCKNYNSTISSFKY